LIFSFLFCLIAANLAHAQESTVHYTLRQFIDSALEHNGDIAAAHWKVAAANAQLRKAQSGRFLSRLRLKSESGLVPEAKGDIFNPPNDTSGVRPLGPFNRTELEFVQPLYPISYGQQLKKAAENGVGVERADLAEARIAAIYEVKKYYYGFLFAQDLLSLVQRLTSELLERQDELADADALPMSSRYKLDLALISLEGQEREVTSKLQLAQRALAWRSGLSETTPVKIRAQWLAPVQAAVPSLEELLQSAAAMRPDWQKLQAGIVARKALRDAARSAYKPQIFIGGGVRYAIAPGRTDQHNPFVKDEFNVFNGAIFLGVRQSLEFHLMAADVDKAQAEYRELRAMKDGALQGIRLDVRRAYANYQRRSGDLESARKSRQLARQWLKEAQEEYEFDPGEIKELITAFESWAQIEQNYYQAIYDFNLSVADLERKTGGMELSKEDADALQTD
jgi:outer membrane protein